MWNRSDHRTDDTCSKLTEVHDLLDEQMGMTLEKEGWVLLQSAIGEDAEESIITLARALGKPIPSRPRNELIDKLQPVPASSARSFSLSRRHGAGAFPFHTDTAHWRTPARFIVIGCVNPGAGGRATLLIRMNDLGLDKQDKELLNSGVFLVRNGRASWYSTVLCRDQPFVRFDPACMIAATPLGDSASLMLQKRCAVCQPIRIKWRKDDVLIIDNWKLLHGRESAVSDYDRVLLRILVSDQSERGII